MSSQPIIIEGIELEIIPKRIRNLNLRITPPQGNVVVTVPHGFPYTRIEQFIRSKSAWIRKHQARIRNAKYAPPLRYESGEEHLFLGEKYRLEIVTGKKGLVKIESLNTKLQDFTIGDAELPELFNHGSMQSQVVSEEKIFKMTVPQRSSKKKRQTLLDGWYRERMKETVPKLIAKYEALMPVKASEWGIKKMKTKWGTCNIRAKRIWINLELAKKPLAEIEHVVVHELVHLMERKHNARFHRLVEEYLAKGNCHKGNDQLEIDKD
ncbi:MAG: M48 family metallopeptidase [Bacteroidota bacterium]